MVSPESGPKILGLGLDFLSEGLARSLKKPDNGNKTNKKLLFYFQNKLNIIFYSNFFPFGWILESTLLVGTFRKLLENTVFGPGFFKPNLGFEHV